jgi:hypothetical protein
MEVKTLTLSWRKQRHIVLRPAGELYIAKIDAFEAANCLRPERDLVVREVFDFQRHWRAAAAF